MRADYFSAKNADILQPAQKVFISWDPVKKIETSRPIARPSSDDRTTRKPTTLSAQLFEARVANGSGQPHAQRGTRRNDPDHGSSVTFISNVAGRRVIR